MGKYRIRIERQAAKELMQIRRTGRNSDIAKVEKIFLELAEHPESGSGNPEKLKHNLSGFWSRRINKKDRLIYKINESEVLVIVLSALGHYEDT